MVLNPFLVGRIICIMWNPGGTPKTWKICKAHRKSCKLSSMIHVYLASKYFLTFWRGTPVEKHCIRPLESVLLSWDSNSLPQCDWDEDCNIALKRKIKVKCKKGFLTFRLASHTHTHSKHYFIQGTTLIIEHYLLFMFSPPKIS